MKIVIITLLVFAIGIAGVLFWTRTREVEINSFWDAVRNPEAMPDLDQFHNDVDEAALSLSGSPSEIAELVDYFVFEAESSRDAWTEIQILAKLGEEAYPRALEILGDVSARDRLVVLTDSGISIPEGPINRLCEIFLQDAPPPPEAGSLLAPFLQSDRKEIRQSVALIIGSVGSADSIPVLRQALTDDREYVRSYALMGIERAISGGRIGSSSVEEFFDLVAGMWPKDTSFEVCDSIPQILLRLDRGRGVERLLGEDLFTARFGPVWRILETFNEESVEIPRPRLLALIDDANGEPLKYPIDNILEEALSLLGEYRHEEDLPTLEGFLDHSNEDVSNGAVRGLYAFHRFFDLIRDPWEVLEDGGWDALMAAEKHFCAVQRLDAEVNNGGFAQYYFNSTGDHWPDALNGLKAIGAKKHHQLMAATIDKFGDSKPATNHDARTSQLSKVVRKKEDPFSEQDSAWYKIEDEPLDRLIFKYNLANREGREKAVLGVGGQKE